MNGNKVSLHIRAIESIKYPPLKRSAIPDGEVEPADSLLKRSKSMSIKNKEIRMGTQELMTISNLLRIVAGIAVGPHQMVIKNVCPRTRQRRRPIQQEVVVGSRLLRVPHYFRKIVLPAYNDRSVRRNNLVQALYVEKLGMLSGRSLKDSGRNWTANEKHHHHHRHHSLSGSEGTRNLQAEPVGKASQDDRQTNSTG